MKPGDLVKFTFAPRSNLFNKGNKSRFGILLEKQKLPTGSWIVLLQTGERIHADAEELELIKECK